LQESEARFRNLFEVISSGVIIYDVIDNGRDFIFKDINPAGERIDNVRREDIIGKSLYEFFPNVGEMGLDEAFRRVWHTGRMEFFPLTLYEDERIALWITNYIYRLPSGELVAVFEDITERKQTEEALAKIAIARKQEIHHRIKNNLQVISSLLDLQAEQFRGRKGIEGSEVLEAFRESQDRVISMALIHEELYKGGGFATLNFAPYIKELAENLFRTYRLGNSDINLKLDLVENAFFDMDIAVPLGMIVNELVSNSLKHAFTGRDEGEIKIKLCRGELTGFECEDCESTSFILTVSDNGIGIPEHLDIEDLDSLGIQLITALVDQLDGEFELKRNNGTEFTMSFAVKENNSSEPVPAQQLIE
jgi:PAS domain S-box-containing protein